METITMKMIHLEKLQALDFRSNEAYKTLRTNTQFCGCNIKAICFTSSLPNEGKSNISFHLAISFAETGRRVVFVDCDLRRSMIVGRYKPDQSVFGLTHYLSGQNDLTDILYATNVPGLDIIFTGPVPPNPAELLAGDFFREMIEILRENYDYVILDTPPLANVIDSAIVAEKCDGVVLIIEKNLISYSLAQRVKQQLEKTNCKLLGAVLNKVEVGGNQYGYYGIKRYKKYEDKYYDNVFYS